jgi:hypothetical protein
MTQLIDPLTFDFEVASRDTQKFERYFPNCQPNASWAPRGSRTSASRTARAGSVAWLTKSRSRSSRLGALYPEVTH